MSEDRFLSRWSRMKTRARGGRATEPAERPRLDPTASAWRPHDQGELAELEPDGNDPAAAAAPAHPEDSVDEAAVLADWPEDLPPPDELDSDSDYSRFFSPEVSEAVRNMALRRLWRSNPLYANVDGLVDYGEDFTDAATVIAGMKSAYQVGRGYARQVEETLAEVEDAPTEPDAATEPASDAVTESDADADPREDRMTAERDEKTVVGEVGEAGEAGEAGAPETAMTAGRSADVRGAPPEASGRCNEAAASSRPDKGGGQAGGAGGY